MPRGRTSFPADFRVLSVVVKFLCETWCWLRAVGTRARVGRRLAGSGPAVGCVWGAGTGLLAKIYLLPTATADAHQVVYHERWLILRGLLRGG